MDRPQATANVSSKPHRVVIRCGFVVALWLGGAIAYASPSKFASSDFNIMNADGTQLIGHGHYEVTSDGNEYVNAFGEDRFNDAEYDIERDQLELRRDGRVPRMVTFEHKFFNANGTLQRVGMAKFPNRTRLLRPIPEWSAIGADHGPAISSGRFRWSGSDHGTERRAAAGPEGGDRPARLQLYARTENSEG